MKKYSKKELIKTAIAFYEENNRPPKIKELKNWRTILRHWKGNGEWEGFLKEAGMPTHEKWEADTRLQSLKLVLAEHGEVSQSEYMKLYTSKKYPYLPDLFYLNRTFGTCSLGTGGKVWALVKNS